MPMLACFTASLHRQEAVKSCSALSWRRPSLPWIAASLPSCAVSSASIHASMAQHFKPYGSVSQHAITPRAKSPELFGKEGTLSGGQVTGEFPCRGSRGTLSGGQCEGAPWFLPFSKKVG